MQQISTARQPYQQQTACPLFNAHHFLGISTTAVPGNKPSPLIVQPHSLVSITHKLHEVHVHKQPRTGSLSLQGASKPTAAAGATTPQEANKTPTLCLFERFERLTLATPSTAAPHTTSTMGAGRGMFSAAPHSAMGSADSSSSAISSADSEQRVRPARRSVAFGTPSVLAYTPARPGEEEAALCADETPLWSNAGQRSDRFAALCIFLQNPGQVLQVRLNHHPHTCSTPLCRRDPGLVQHQGMLRACVCQHPLPLWPCTGSPVA
jgi:hypothetical protein